MIKRLISSKYRREIEESSLRIKACEELRIISPNHYDKVIENYKNRIEELNLKIDKIERFNLIGLNSIKQNFAKSLWISIFILLFIGIFYLKPAIIGYVIEQNSMEYRIDINETFSNSGTYIFDIGDKGILTSLKISGDVIGKGTIKVYMEKDGIKYIVLDSSILKDKGVPTITSFAVKEGEDKEKDEEYKNKDEKIKEKEIINEITPIVNETVNITLPQNATVSETTSTNQTINITPIINETTPILNKSIKINLQYKEDSVYDEDNDGIENINNAIDLIVENTQFNWDADESKLCTIWEVYNINEDKATTICYGSNECCNLINLESSRENWYEPFYSVYGQNGVGLNNIISSRVIYANYSLNVDNPYADVLYSEWSNLSTAYNYEKIIFKGICKETCFLDGFNESSYTIMVDVENAALVLNEIIYSFLPKIEKYKLRVKINGKDELEKLSVYQYDHLVISEEKPELDIESGIYDIDIILINEPIKEVILHNIKIKSDIEKNIIFDEIKNNITLDGVEIKKKYWIDSSLIENETIIAKSAGNSLFICKDWNYELESCFDNWEKIHDLKIGELYNISTGMEIQAFIEGDINITPANISELNITKNATDLLFIRDIPNITISINDNATINLSNYFANIDGETIFAYYEQDDAIILFDNETATISPNENFVGILFTYITANKSNSLAISNIFSINVTGPMIEIMPANINLINITDPLIQQKLKNSADLDLKPALKYNTINFTGYEIKNDVVIIYITYDDDKNMRWLTSLRNFNEVIS